MKKQSYNENGQVLLMSLVFLIFVLFFLMGLLTYTGSQIVFHRNNILKSQALNIAEGGTEMAIWKLNNVANYSGETNTSYGSGMYTVTLTTISASNKLIKVDAYIPNSTSPTVHRVVQTVVNNMQSQSASFYYGVSVGEGGLVNNGTIHGNVFSNGNITGSGSIDNDVIVSGNGHSIKDVSVGGNVKAYSCLSSATITGNLTYVTGGTQTCTVHGTISTQSDEITEEPLPIPQSQIDDWEAEASTACSAANISSLSQNNKTVSMGNCKVTGNLVFGNGTTLNLTGTIYVTGNVVLGTSDILKLDPSFGYGGGVLILDGTIETKPGSSFAGSGQQGSYFLIVSTNASDSAVTVKNNITGAVFYTTQGAINILNNVSVVEATGYKVIINSGSEIQYSTGLVNIYFSGGPGATWAFTRGSYVITK